MPSHSGPNTTGEDNLVFAYDLGDVSNSYKGEPTANITPNYYLAWSTLSGTRTANAIEDSDGVLQGMNLTGTANTQVRTEFSQANPSQEGYYTFSVEGKRGSSPYIGLYTYMTPYASPHVIYNIDTNTITAATSNIYDYGVEYVKDGWYRIWMTVLIRTDQTYRLWKVVQTDSTNPSGGTVDGYVYYAKAQLENKPYVTPFTTGTRSATNSLIDLTKSTDIDLSNVSFDSNAQMTFDGTDDWLNIPIVLNAGNFTYETVMKQFESTSYNIFSAGTGDPSSGGTNIQAVVNSSGGKVNHYAPVGGSGWEYGTYDNTGNFTATSNVNYHIVVVNSNTTWKIYVNGELVGDIDSFVPSVGNRVGVARSTMQAANNQSSQVSLTKLYNRALTAQEVLQNYQQYKTRFNLS